MDSARKDLIVDQASLRQHWVVRVEDLPASFCSVQEGEITPGEHTLVRFTVATPNIGDADLVVGDPNQHVGDGLFEFASCHNHYHFRRHALYELGNPRTGFVWRAAKRGFCMIDVEKYQLRANRSRQRFGEGSETVKWRRGVRWAPLRFWLCKVFPGGQTWGDLICPVASRDASTD